MLVPRPGMEPAPPAVEAQNLNHWTTWEVRGVTVFKWFAYVACVKWYYKFALESISFITIEIEPYILETFSLTLDGKATSQSFGLF